MRTFLAAVALVLVSGCYAQQHWGPTDPQNLTLMRAGTTTKVEVLRALGAPDSVIPVGDADIWVYRAYRGITVCGVYTAAHRSDFFISFDSNDTVIETFNSETGDAIGIFTPMLNPVQPSETAR